MVLYSVLCLFSTFALTAQEYMTCGTEWMEPSAQSISASVAHNSKFHLAVELCGQYSQSFYIMISNFKQRKTCALCAASGTRQNSKNMKKMQNKA